MSRTIQESANELHKALCEYIEATYHIADPALIAARRRLLTEPGNIHQVPYLESTPKYISGDRFASIQGLPGSAVSVLENLARPMGSLKPLLYDPPYSHQSDALRESVGNGANLLIMTGTGSGKTESFLMPIMAKLAREASDSPNTFSRHAVRALLLYPMNALVNDQLGRLRSLFSDPRVTEQFKAWSGRVPRFARYTSRTPYAGVRDKKKDDQRLGSLEDFYVQIELACAGSSAESAHAKKLKDQLERRGKWPSKPSLSAWLGKSGTAWQRRGTGEFVRAVTLPDDSELITRHEVQVAPPDLLITNYSMLEYMLMRPIERPIFDQTRDWLVSNPEEKFLVVLDEAHLYRGAAGAEVGLLLRRLTDRLGITADRIQAVCATASFQDRDYAKEFGAQLSGCLASTFVPIVGTLDRQPAATPGSLDDASALGSVDVDQLADATDSTRQLAAVENFLSYRDVEAEGDVDAALYKSLENFPPLQLVVNLTMGHAQPIAQLPEAIFPKIPSHIADRALSNLLTLGSRARSPNGAGLLPCRLHTFFRGFPGLWACMDPQCPSVSHEERNAYCGKMYSQPRDRCECGARCLELYTCRHCGTAYARAYTDNVDEPSALWAEPGANLQFADGETGRLEALDLLLQPPTRDDDAEPADYDVETGRLNAHSSGPRARRVYLRVRTVDSSSDDDEPHESESRGVFAPCGICRKVAGGGRSSVQDHMTKGDQPFQALVSRQIQIQTEGPRTDDEFAPLRGRKVLVFSDSRQVAARLAPNLQTFSMRDVIRPLLIYGVRALQQASGTSRSTTLDDAYFATLFAAKRLNVRLRPELQSGESFSVFAKIGAMLGSGSSLSDDEIRECWEDNRSSEIPASMLEELVTVIGDSFTGLEALALASVCERPSRRARLLERLSDIPGVAVDRDSKISLVRFWLRCWTGKQRIWFAGMPPSWWSTRVEGHTGQFQAINRVLPGKPLKALFNREWLPVLLEEFTEQVGSKFSLRAKNLYLEIGGSWVRCNTCTSVHRPVNCCKLCVDCGNDSVEMIDPDQDQVFLARKGYYRRAVIGVLQEAPVVPLALVAAEHTAQLNSSQNEDAFSKAEQNELLFQDLDISWRESGERPVAIDILSSTTTMEVGIDIGALSGVALRNMPPGRANYQQRAGRAGRRGNCVATVVAFGSVDSHDEHYFRKPQEMISGQVIDPRLTLDNLDIAKRHVRAFLLQKYHQDRLPQFAPDQPADLFSVLGRVGTFRDGKAVLNRDDFFSWLALNKERLQVGVRSWIPKQLRAEDAEILIGSMVEDCVQHIDKAIHRHDAVKPNGAASAEEPLYPLDVDPDVEQPTSPKSDNDKLLDRLLYEGVLPRYAFPTDVATFHIFNKEGSTSFRHRDEFSPSQGLPIALSQYAPGKQVWVSGKCYTSGAIYSPMKEERIEAWERRQIYLECGVCHFADTRELGASSGAAENCPACKTPASFGPGKPWLRPVGFAHPIDLPEETSPDRVPETSFATRAKLTLKTPGEEAQWNTVNGRFAGLPLRQHLLVTNTGHKNKGYCYCRLCGRIESMTEPNPVLGGHHQKPFPTKPADAMCRGSNQLEVVLGANFVTDIALFSLQVAPPLGLVPGAYVTNVALRTLSEAFARAASRLLEIEPGEVLAEFRPAMGPNSDTSLCAEIFLYDTLPGGAGFSSSVAHRGTELLKEARKLLVDCPERCDSSCYRCLRTFGNKFEHRSLDRHVGAELIDYLMAGDIPEFDEGRVAASTKVLFEDLSRLDDGSKRFQFSMNQIVCLEGGDVFIPILAEDRSAGGRVIIGLCSALTDGYAADASVRALQEERPDVPVVLVNELLVRCNLPAATRVVLDAIRG